MHRSCALCLQAWSVQSYIPPHILRPEPSRTGHPTRWSYLSHPADADCCPNVTDACSHSIQRAPKQLSQYRCWPFPEGCIPQPLCHMFQLQAHLSRLLICNSWQMPHMLLCFSSHMPQPGNLKKARGASGHSLSQRLNLLQIVQLRHLRSDLQRKSCMQPGQCWQAISSYAHTGSALTSLQAFAATDATDMTVAHRTDRAHQEP